MRCDVWHATLHPLHTPQAEPFMRHATTILTKCFNWYINRNCNFGNFSKVLICAPWGWSSRTETCRGYVKHLNTNCSILCFNKQCIRWRNSFVHISASRHNLLSMSYGNQDTCLVCPQAGKHDKVTFSLCVLQISKSCMNYGMAQRFMTPWRNPAGISCLDFIHSS
jgi:hypothetical protein